MAVLDFLIIGEMKCGTTTLWSLLDQHPQVFRPLEKELHFFGSYSYFGASGPDRLGDLAQYQAHFAEAAPGQLRGEATPNYLVDRLAPQRIAETAPGARLVAVLRDPIARAWSHYWHVVRRGWEDLDFEDALDAEEARIARGDDEREKFSYMTRGKYVQNLRRYEALFGRDAICVVFLDELKGNRQAVVEEVWRHIGCQPPYAALDSPAHENRADYPKWPWASRLTQRGMNWARGRGGLVQAMATRVRASTRPLLVYQGGPRMAPHVMVRLQQEFEQPNRELAEWLGRPLPWMKETVAV